MESDDQDDQTLTQDIANLSGELGDDAPASSLGRAPNLRRDIGVSPARVLALLDEAAARIAGALSRQVDDDVGARVDAASPPTRTPRGPCQARRPTTETQPVWRAVLDALGQVLTVENVNAWLASTRALDTRTVRRRASFNREWLAQRLAGTLHKIDDTRYERSPSCSV